MLEQQISADETVSRLEREVQDLSAQMQALIVEREAFRENAERLSAETQTLNTQIAAVIAERELFRSHAERADADAGRLAELNSALVAERDAFRLEARRLSGEIAALDGQIGLLSAEREAFRSHAESLASTVQALSDRNAALLTERDTFRAEAERQSEDVGAVNAQIGVIIAEREAFRGHAENLSSSMRLLSEQNAALIAERDAFRSEAERLSAALAKIGEEAGGGASSEQADAAAGQPSGWAPDPAHLAARIVEASAETLSAALLTAFSTLTHEKRLALFAALAPDIGRYLNENSAFQIDVAATAARSGFTMIPLTHSALPYAPRIESGSAGNSDSGVEDAVPSAPIDHAAFAADYRAMVDALANGPDIYKPSRFWTELNGKNDAALGEDLNGFKRSINNNYFQWLPGGFADDQYNRLLRGWSENPNGLPLNVVADSARHGRIRNVKAFNGDNPFSEEQYFRLYAFFVGLLWDFAGKHDLTGLHDRIQEPAVGDPLPIRHGQRLISQDLANSLLEWSRVTALAAGLDLPEPISVLELGAGYGRVANVALLARPCAYTIVDIPPALTVSQYYLSTVFPHKKIFKFRDFADFSEIENEYMAADIRFLGAHQLELLPPDSVDISISISSLHEMTRPQIEQYKRLIETVTRSLVYFKQWTSWTNPSDKIDVGRADFMLSPPWRKIYDEPHPILDAMTELAFAKARP